jgi:hypothetical protein
MKRTPVLVLAILFLACLGAGCNSGPGECGEGEQPGLTINAIGNNPQANGTDFYRVSVSGKDEFCQRLPAGTTVRLNLANAQPEGVGYFHTTTGGNPTSVELRMSDIGASANVRSTVAGTVSLTGLADEYNLMSMPTQLSFREPQQTGQCGLNLTASKASLLATDTGDSTVLTAVLTGDSGLPMPDNTDVTFTTNLGTFQVSGAKNLSVRSSGGQAQATLRSERLTAPGDATVTATFVCNDAAQSQESSQLTIRFVLQQDEPQVVLTSNRSSVLADDFSTAELTAEVFLPGGVRAGAGEEVEFSTNLGRFEQSGTQGLTAYTDATGKAYATFVGGGDGGLATVRAAIYIDGMNAFHTTQINVRQVGFVQYVSAVPDKLGVKGSGVNETSQLTFLVKDTSDQPFADVLVDFNLSVAPGVTLEPLQARTDSAGRVRTTLKSGTLATTVTVTARATVGNVQISAVSPSLAIVGAKPNQRYLTFSCELLNRGAWVNDDVNTTCTVLLADRYTNKVGFATNVTFMTEAGHITPSALTGITGDNMGRAAVTMRTANPRPRDVPPMPGEPFSGANNPRDGLVTLIASTTGEEEFQDQNGNGEYDPGEPFVDISEPLLDTDDNGIWNAGDQFIDGNGNGVWDPPNGRWDGEALIWQPTWMVWTGGPVGVSSHAACGSQFRYTSVCPENECDYNGTWGFAPVLPTTGTYFDWVVVDANFLPLNSSARITTSTGQRLTVQSGGSVNVLDLLGVPIAFRARDASSGALCEPTHTICHRRIEVDWTGWRPYGGVTTVMGPSASQSDPYQTHFTLKVNYKEAVDEGVIIEV